MLYNSKSNQNLTHTTNSDPSSHKIYRRIGLLISIIFFLTAIFLLISFISYIENNKGPNKMGIVGHWLAETLFETYLGTSALILPPCCLLLALQQLIRPSRSAFLTLSFCAMLIILWCSHALAYLHKSWQAPATWYFSGGQIADRVIDKTYELLGEGVLLVLLGILAGLLIWYYDLLSNTTNDQILTYQPPSTSKELVTPPYKEIRENEDDDDEN